MNELEKGHVFSANHKAQLLQDQRCGCFYCLAIFDPREITVWIDDPAGTAVCPLKNNNHSYVALTRFRVDIEVPYKEAGRIKR